jgi:hypothetical protein
MIFLLDSRGLLKHHKDVELIKKWLECMVEKQNLKLRELEVKYPRVRIRFFHDSFFDS